MKLNDVLLWSEPEPDILDHESDLYDLGSYAFQDQRFIHAHETVDLPSRQGPLQNCHLHDATDGAHLLFGQHC